MSAFLFWGRGHAEDKVLHLRKGDRTSGSATRCAMEALRDLLTLSVAEMYNILQLTDILVLDIRAGVAYDLLHIKTALNVDVAALKAITMEGILYSFVQTISMITYDETIYVSF